MSWSQLLFGFQGRVNRGKYWLVGLVVIAVWIAYFIVGLVMLGNSIDDLLSFAGAGIFLWLIGVIIFIVTMWSGIAVGVKRLHDRNKSGWWVLVFYLLPSLLSSPQAQAASGSMALSLVGLGISIWGFVELGCLRGTPGENQYGPDPLNRLSNEPLR